MGMGTGMGAGTNPDDGEIGIVVAEDHALVRQGLKLVLSREPRMRWLGEAGDGDSALQRVRELRPQVLLLDLGLPQRDGLDVMQALTAEGLPTRVLVVTGGTVPGLVQTLVADGWVERRPDPADGRSQIVALTARGRREFLAMAAEHEQWLQALFQGFEKTHASTLYEMLGRLRVHLVERTADEGAAAKSRSAR